MKEIETNMVHTISDSVLTEKETSTNTPLRQNTKLSSNEKSKTERVREMERERSKNSCGPEMLTHFQYI